MVVVSTHGPEFDREGLGLTFWRFQRYRLALRLVNALQTVLGRLCDTWWIRIVRVQTSLGGITPEVPWDPAGRIILTRHGRLF